MTILYHIITVWWVLCISAISLLANPNASDDRTKQRIKVDSSNIACLKLRYSEPRSVADASKKTAELARSLSYPKGEADALQNGGAANWVLGDYVEAFSCFKQALKLREQLNDTLGLSETTNSLGVISHMQNNLPQALEYYLRSLDLKKKAGDQKGIAMVYNNIGTISKEQGEWKKAIDYYMQAIAINRALGDTLRAANNMANIASIYYDQGEKDLVIALYRQALQLAEAARDGFLAASFSNNLALAYTTIDADSAEYYFGKAIAWGLRNNTSKGIAQSYLGMANLSLIEGHDHKAYQFAQEGLLLAKDAEELLQVGQAYQLLSKIASDLGNFKEAFTFHQHYMVFKDSLEGQAKLDEVKQIALRYEIQQKETENVLLRQKFEWNEAKLQTQRWLSGVSLIAIVLLAISVLFLSRIIRLRNMASNVLKLQKAEIVKKNSLLEKANDEFNQLNHTLEERIRNRTAMLEQANQELDTFLYRSSHDLRQPLTAIMGLTQLGLLTDDHENCPELYDKIGQTAQKMDNLLSKLLMASELHVPSSPKILVVVDSVVHKLLAKLDPMIFVKNVSVHVDVPPALSISGHSVLIETLFFNIIENAIIFSALQTIRPPEVWIKASESEASVMVRVLDNGIGLPAKEKEKLFGMFQRGYENADGSGLGLYISNKAALQIGASINAFPTPKGLTCFEIEFPKHHQEKEAVA